MSSADSSTSSLEKHINHAAFVGIREPLPCVSTSRLNPMKSRSLLLPILASLGLSLSYGVAQDKVPDLTKGDKPTFPRKSKKLLAGNLGPTGLIGWVYEDRGNTRESRQILVTEIAKGSPADGTLKVGDVILGASGDTNKPANFSSDARKSFAYAIAEAEARNPATLYLNVWRQGKTNTLALQLETMGAYSKTAPYNCPKTMKVIAKSLAYLEKNELKRDRFGLNILPLLACDDPQFPGREARLEKAREWVTSLIPDKNQYEGMISDQVETYSKVAWNRTYHLVVMAEYYLATGDNPSRGGISLLEAIDAHAQTVSRGQSMFGTMGHQFALQAKDGSVHGPYAVGYGPVNATGLTALTGLTLARECKLPSADTNAQIEAGIKRAADFFSYYAHRGAIPYGEHGPWKKSHCSNGKSGMAAVAFANIPGREDEAKFFSKLAVASGSERPGGHGGSYFNYLWTPIGASVGGSDATTAYFQQVTWHLDLSRTWDGGFYYNDYTSHGYHGATFGKASLYMSTPALLTYALGMNKIHLTGKHLSELTKLTSGEIANAVIASGYNASKRSMDQLISDLGNFSPVVRNQAAAQLVAKADGADLKTQLQKIAVNQDHPSQRGAVLALGMLGDADSAALLVMLFNNPDTYICEEAIEAFSKLPVEIQTPQIDTLLRMAALLKRDPMKVNPKDPMNSTLITLTDILMDGKGILSNGLGPVKKYSSMELLYDALRSMAAHPNGSVRGKIKTIYDHLSNEDIKALDDTVLELIHVEAPADAMFAENIRSSTAKLLLERNFEEGVPASIELYKVGGRWTRVVIIKSWGEMGASIKAHSSWPEIENILKTYNDDKFKKEAEKALASINKSKAKPEKFISLK